MDTYAHDGALYCEDCGLRLTSEMIRRGDHDELPELVGDGGGESDCPQHCDTCGVFLENPLTTDGYRYVLDLFRQFIEDGRGDRGVLAEWSEFYSEVWDR